jgi:hypothetical protein
MAAWRRSHAEPYRVRSGVSARPCSRCQRCPLQSPRRFASRSQSGAAQVTGGPCPPSAPGGSWHTSRSVPRLRRVAAGLVRRVRLPVLAVPARTPAARCTTRRSRPGTWRRPGGRGAFAQACTLAGTFTFARAFGRSIESCVAPKITSGRMRSGRARYHGSDRRRVDHGAQPVLAVQLEQRREAGGRVVADVPAASGEVRQHTHGGERDRAFGARSGTRRRAGRGARGRLAGAARRQSPRSPPI